MKHLVFILISLYLFISIPTQAVTPEEDWQARSAHPDVIRAVGFDNVDIVENLSYRLNNSKAQYVSFDSTTKASGEGAMRFEIVSGSGANSGNWRINFSDDPYPVKLGVGDDFYIQWRQRFSASFLDTVFDGGNGWKQSIVGEGDRAGIKLGQVGEATSCTRLEVVVQNTRQRHFPQMYHSCGDYFPFQEKYLSFNFKLQNAIDKGPDISPVENRFVLYPYEKTDVNKVREGSPAQSYHPEEWMTFQVHIPGPLGTALDPRIGQNRSGFTQSTVEMWVARDGQPSVKTISFNNVVLQRDDSVVDTGEKFGYSPITRAKVLIRHIPQVIFGMTS